jgi:hypothetical protein
MNESSTSTLPSLSCAYDRLSTFRRKVKRIDLKFADRVSNGRDAIDDGGATVDNHDRNAVEVNQSASETRRGDFHGFVAHDHAEHPASADKFVEERLRIHGVSIVGKWGC